ncbi:hypothetical protein GCM10020256_72560 [Streptomyces thermocoprophilus]
MDGSNALGEFLRARRALVRPEDVGLPGGGLRRVPGLRREEVALLAGISSDYYLRLEQGRDRNPSAQVLQAVARVLRLDADATAHLLGLARRRSEAGARPGRLTEQVPASIRQLIDTWPRTPRLCAEPVHRLPRRQHPRRRALPELPARRQPAAGRVPRPGRTGAAPGLDGADRRRGGGPCARPPEATRTIPGCATWSASCPCTANASAPCGPATTYGPGAAVSATWRTLRSANSTSSRTN